MIIDKSSFISTVDELVDFLISMPNNFYFYFTLKGAEGSDKNLYAIVGIDTNEEDVILKTLNEKSVDNPYWKDDILEELMPLNNKGYILKVLVNEKYYCILALDSPIQDKGSANRYIIEIS